MSENIVHIFSTSIKLGNFNVFIKILRRKYVICRYLGTRKNPVKYEMLKKRVRKPSEAPIANYEEQFRLLRTLSQRVIEDMEQLSIVVNYLEDQLVMMPSKKRVKLKDSKEREREGVSCLEGMGHKAKDGISI